MDENNLKINKTYVHNDSTYCSVVHGTSQIIR